MIKKVIEGYISRDGHSLYFSNKPMKQSGFFGDGGIWYPTIEYEEDSPMDFREDMHEYMDIPELTEEESPRHCTITIEVGDFYGEKLDADFIQKRGNIMRSVRGLAEETGITLKEVKAEVMKFMPEISKYLED